MEAATADLSPEELLSSSEVSAEAECDSPSVSTKQHTVTPILIFMNEVAGI